MDPPSNAHDAPSEGTPEEVKETVGSPLTDGGQEKKQFGPPVESAPRPARLASPASSCRGGVAASPPPPPRQAPPTAAGGRSVKSIVEWLEGPKQPDSPPATSVASGPARKIAEAVSVPTAAPDRHDRAADQGTAHTEDVEDYSLTYLNYKGFYQGAPLARCLDGVEEDLSKKSLEDIFKEAEKNTASGRTLVNVTSPLSFSPAAAEEKTPTIVGEHADASKHAASSDAKPANVERAKVSQATAAGNVIAPPAQEVGGIADGKTGAAGPVAATDTVASAGNQGPAAAPAAPGPEGQEFIQRDPQEVQAF